MTTILSSHLAAMNFFEVVGCVCDFARIRNLNFQAGDFNCLRLARRGHFIDLHSQCFVTCMVFMLALSAYCVLMECRQ